MSGRYLTELASLLRAAHLEVIEYPGWQGRARSSGGYGDGKPLCVMWHHTASGAGSDGQSDASYIAEGDEDAPLANLYIERSGAVWVLAAGATNTNGKGKSLSFSRGTVPADSMNTHALGIEIGNGGTGEAWNELQLIAAFTASNAINAHLGNLPTDVASHQHYAPDRKIDPATAAAVQGPWNPRSINSSGTWNVDDLRNECHARWHGAPPLPGPDPLPPGPGPSDGDDEMRMYAYLDPNGTIWVGNGVQRRALSSMDTFSQYVILSGTGGGPQLFSANGVQVRELGHVATVGHETIEGLGVDIT